MQQKCKQGSVTARLHFPEKPSDDSEEWIEESVVVTQAWKVRGPSILGQFGKREKEYILL